MCLHRTFSSDHFKQRFDAFYKTSFLSLTLFGDDDKLQWVLLAGALSRCLLFSSIAYAHQSKASVHFVAPHDFVFFLIIPLSAPTYWKCAQTKYVIKLIIMGVRRNFSREGETSTFRLSWVYTREFSRGKPHGSLVYSSSLCALLRSHANHCEVIRIEAGPIARRLRAEMSCRT